MLIVLDVTVLLLILYAVKVLLDLQKEITKNNGELKTLFVNGEESKSSIEDMLRIYEDERDREFNDKIENLKLELYGTTADVLHPDLKNIPHEDYDAEIIKTQIVAEEYAE